MLGVVYTIDIDSKKRWNWAVITGSVLTGEANEMAGVGNLLKAPKNIVAFNITDFLPWKCTDNALYA